MLVNSGRVNVLNIRKRLVLSKQKGVTGQVKDRCLLRESGEGKASA